MPSSLLLTSILLSYDEPLIVEATDSLQRKHVGINYAGVAGLYKFAFVQVEAKDWQMLQQQRIDLRFIYTDKRATVYRAAIIAGEVGEKFDTKPTKDDPELFLPEPGLFLSIQDKVYSKKAGQRTRLATKIDGRWDLEDLKDFATLAGDAYAFTYALVSPEAERSSELKDLFSRYPWRGGFSTINFISDLHASIPAAADISIAEIKYASPGFIDTRVDEDIARAVTTIVEEINQSANTSEGKYWEVYNSVKNDLKKNKWSGQATLDLKLTRYNERVLEQHLTTLCETLGLGNRLRHILALGQNDMLAAVKIMLAFYRRMFWVAKYLRTGRVQHLFSYQRT